jgi:hypothetical protein
MAHTDRPDAQMGSTSSPPVGGEAMVGDATPVADLALQRRAYRTPELRLLGSVRELTLGGTGPLAEGGGTRKPLM